MVDMYPAGTERPKQICAIKSVVVWKAGAGLGTRLQEKLWSAGSCHSPTDMS
jgi:hypothetical protein